MKMIHLKFHLKAWLLFLVSYVFFILIQLKAVYLVNAGFLPSDLSLKGISGSIWQGQVESAQWQEIELKKIGWHFNWTSLFTMKPSVTVHVDDKNALQGDITIGYHGDLLLSDGHLHAPLSFWLAKLPMSLPVGVSGDVQLSIDDIALSAVGCKRMSAIAEWQEANVQSPFGKLDLGAPKIQMKCQGQQFTFVAEQNSDVLSSQNELKVHLNGQYDVQSDITPKPALPPVLLDLLKSEAKPMGSGRFQLHDQGTF